MQKEINEVPRFLTMALLILTALLFLTAGCNVERRAQFAHLKGTLAWKQGDWNTAVVYFCEAELLAAQLSDKRIESYTDFALAASYMMQNEDKAASGRLRRIPETATELLRSQCFYQQGIIAFRAKKYADAAALFRKSLELNGADMEAKINYELSKKQCDKQQEVQRGAPRNAAETVEQERTDSIILDIIRKREQAEWKKLQRESEPSINDY